ncbi:MAG: ABC transporter ATP-binding protein [Spirochaetaceae bacterium]|nr:ABC transporter ATP-binding protein [Spirochaetaceae bacterium]
MISGEKDSPPQFFSCHSLKKSYGEKPVIADVSIELPAGAFVSLIGKSGVGKTTLFRLLSGVETPDSGEVFLNGKAISGRAGFTAYMPQKDLLLEHLSVLDNIALPLLIKKQNRKKARAYVHSFLGEFGLAAYENSYPHELSGGMRQKASLLRVCMQGNTVVLLDEPFSALDAISRTKIHEWYENLARAFSLSTFCITHDIEEALKLSDRVYVMRGSPASIRASFELPQPRPRGREFFLSLEYLDLKRNLFEALEE